MCALDIGVVGQNIVRNDGQGRAMLELVRALAERGHHLTVYTHRLDPELTGAVRLRTIGATPGPQALDDLVMLARATWAVRRAGHDVTCILGPTAIPRPPFAFDAQFSHRGWRRTWTPDTRPPLAHRIHARWTELLETAIARRSAVVIASTEVVGADLLGDEGPERQARATTRPPVVAVPLGIDPSEHPPAAPTERAAARASYGLGDGDVAVAFLGGFQTGRKGLAPLPEAIARGGEHLIVGGSGDEAALMARVASLGLQERIHIRGFVPPGGVLAAADIVAVPSLYEPFSLVGLEAASRGLPVVIATVAGVAAHLEGVAVPIADAADVGLVRAALDQLRSPEERRRRGGLGPAAAHRLAWRSITGPAADAVEALAADGAP